MFAKKGRCKLSAKDFVRCLRNVGVRFSETLLREGRLKHNRHLIRIQVQKHNMKDASCHVHKLRVSIYLFIL